MYVLEILALIFIVITIFKAIGFWVIDPKKLMDFAEKTFKQTKLMNGILVIGVLIVGYFLFSNISVVAVVSAMLFTHLLIGMFFVAYPKSYQVMVKDVFKNKQRTWFVWLIYVVISLWALYKIVV